MKTENKRLLDAFEYLDAKYIDELFDVLDTPPRRCSQQSKKSNFRYYAALAACLVLLAVAFPVFNKIAEVISSFAAGRGSGTTEEMSDFATMEDSSDESKQNTTEYEYNMLTPTLDYLRFIPELEPITEELMYEIKDAWSQYQYDISYKTAYDTYNNEDYDKSEIKVMASEYAESVSKTAKEQFFNTVYFFFYGYLGTFDDTVVIAAYSGAGQPLNGLIVGDIDFGTRAQIYVYADEKIMKLQEAYDMGKLTVEELAIISKRNEQYAESAYDYYAKQFQQRKEK